MSALLTRAAPRAAAGHDGRRGQGPAGARDAEPLEGVGLDPAGAPVGGRLTLGQRLDSVWEGLHAGGAPDCPVCRAQLGPLGAGPAVRCEACGSVLS